MDRYSMVVGSTLTLTLLLLYEPSTQGAVMPDTICDLPVGTDREWVNELDSKRREKQGRNATA